MKVYKITMNNREKRKSNLREIFKNIVFRPPLFDGVENKYTFSVIEK